MKIKGDLSYKKINENIDKFFEEVSDKNKIDDFFA
jgi:hypothetical protein